MAAKQSLDDALADYLRAVRSQRSHAGKVHQFIRFLEVVFQIQVVDYELEERADDAQLQVRGRIDTVVGDTLFEFKTNLKRERDDAQAQLTSYLAVFHARSPNRRCVGIATDGVEFEVYEPAFAQEGLPTLKLVERQDLGRLSGEDALLWLDRYLFRRTPRVPDERDVVARFGAQSPTYSVTLSALEEWWGEIKEEPPIALKYELWLKQLTVVYGEGIGSEDLFLQHTYLATFAKLLASLIFRPRDEGAELDILTGAYFLELGIQNFIEEDLFSWMLHKSTKRRALRLIHDLRAQLSQYDASGFSEDVLKGLYQGLVDPEVRQALGEFYTPDWLAEYMLRETLRGDMTARLLDPACGSGTFLFLAIRLVTEALRKKGWSQQRMLAHVQDHICGLDVHPLAVLISRTNYLIACAPLLAKGRRGTFTVPVYLGDSLMYRSMVGTMDSPEPNVPADGETLWFPAQLRDDPVLFDDVVANVVHAAGRGDEAVFGRYIARHGFTGRERDLLLNTLRSLTKLFAEGRDSIWRFVIRNLIRPYIFSRGQPFDLLIGNPPWLSLRYIKSPDYQKFVKDQMWALGIKPRGAKLVTQLELATLFFAECARNYLREGGVIAFVMPRSVLIHRQHVPFMKFYFGPFGVRCYRILDLGDVGPLFSVPACALLAEKGRDTTFPIPRTVFAGRLPRKNASWQDARRVLGMHEDEWSPTGTIRKGASAYYLDKFRQGATLVPRRLWFVRLVSDPRLGFNPDAPLVESDLSLPAKKPWADIAMHGQVEAEAIYASVLSTDILPFHCLRLRPVVLPLALDGDTPVLLTSTDAHGRGLRHLGGWLEQAEAAWAAHKTDKSPEAVTEWVDYLGKLHAQFPQSGRFMVLYCAATRETTGAVIDQSDSLQLEVDGATLTMRGLATEHQVYWFRTDSVDEAFYLLAWVNSMAVDDAVRPKALWGPYRERHLEKRIVEIGPPRFDPSNARHQEMSGLAKQAADVVAKLAPSLASRSLGTVRRAVRTHREIAPLLKRIDELAAEIGGF